MSRARRCAGQVATYHDKNKSAHRSTHAMTPAIAARVALWSVIALVSEHQCACAQVLAPPTILDAWICGSEQSHWNDACAPEHDPVILNHASSAQSEPISAAAGAVMRYSPMEHQNATLEAYVVLSARNRATDEGNSAINMSIILFLEPYGAHLARGGTQMQRIQLAQWETEATTLDRP